MIIAGNAAFRIPVYNAISIPPIAHCRFEISSFPHHNTMNFAAPRTDAPRAVKRIRSISGYGCPRRRVTRKFNSYDRAAACDGIHGVIDHRYAPIFIRICDESARVMSSRCDLLSTGKLWVFERNAVSIPGIIPRSSRSARLLNPSSILANDNDCTRFAFPHQNEVRNIIRLTLIRECGDIN